MKKMMLFFVTTFLLLTSSTYAGEFYTKLLGGVNFLQTERHAGVRPRFHPGYIVSGAVGYRWCDGLNVEAEYAFRRSSMKELHFFGQDFDVRGYFQSSSYMANVIWEFPSWEYLNCIQPFAGVGIGYDLQQFHASEAAFRIDRDRKGFAWQVMLGLSYPLHYNAEMAFEYRFHKGPLQNVFSHALAVSLIYKFTCLQE